MKQDLLLKGIDFQVAMKPAMMRVGSKEITVPDKFVTYRTDNNEPLGIVGNRYEIVQHTESMQMIDKAVQKISSDYVVENKIFYGRIYSTFHLNDYGFLSNIPHEEAKLSIDVIHSHDGFKKLQFGIAAFRQWCTNGARGFVTEFLLKKLHLKNVTNDVYNQLGNLSNILAEHKKAYETFYEVLIDKKPLPEKNLKSAFSGRMIEWAREAYIEERKGSKGDSAWLQYNAFTRVLTRKNLTVDNRQVLQKQLSKLFLNYFHIAQ